MRDKVKEQVGFEGTLLDSKCFPLMANKDTSDPDFWRSTRKVIAASQSVYEKLGGVSGKREMVEGMCVNVDVEGEPSRKKARLSKGKGKQKEEEFSTENCVCIAKLDGISKQLDGIERRLHLFDNLKKSFECCICTSTCAEPVVAPCCGQIVGCSACTDRWLTNHARCPLCSSSV